MDGTLHPTIKCSFYGVAHEVCVPCRALPWMDSTLHSTINVRRTSGGDGRAGVAAYGVKCRALPWMDGTLA